MGGLFGVVTRREGKRDFDTIDCIFYGTDYHSHLGTERGGLASHDVDLSNGESGFFRFIHDISNTPFRSKFEFDVKKMRGSSGIGVISDSGDQPLIIKSHLGTYAIASVGRINNIGEIVEEASRNRQVHFAETGRGVINSTEVMAVLINAKRNYVEGIENVWRSICGSSSMLLLTEEGIYAARDKLGRTPLVLGKTGGGTKYAVASESTAFPNLGFEVERELGPGEIVLINKRGFEQKRKAEEKMQICSFLFVYFGFPSSDYEGENVDEVRYRCGAELAKADADDIKEGKLNIDFVSPIPDSGTGHAIGYANESKLPYGRAFAKYTPTWPRSFMPPDQKERDLIAKMKLIPNIKLIRGKRILFCEDSVVRGTQLRNAIKELFEKYGAKEVHLRPACPPLIYGCEKLNFSRSRSKNELAGQRAIRAIEGIDKDVEIPGEMLRKYREFGSEKYNAMVEWIRKDLGLTSLRYPSLGGLVSAIGVPKERLCTYCWDGCG